MVDELVPCPLCGSVNGYGLGYGDCYKWFSVTCKGCGDAVTDCRAGEHNSPPETRTTEADNAWNDEARAEGARLKSGFNDATDAHSDFTQMPAVAANAAIAKAAGENRRGE